jgi:sec-independent protein translocase protein TatA
MVNLLAFFSPGPVQMVIVLAVMLLLFGHRLPSTMRSLGKGLTEFKKGLKDSDDPEEPKLEDKSAESKA